MVASLNKVVTSLIFIAMLLLAKGNTTVPLQTDWASLGNPGTTLRSSPSVGQNVDGRLEVFSIDSREVLWHKWQTAPNAGWSGSWASLGSPPNVTGLSGPFVARNADGRLEVFGIGTDGALWHIWQLTAAGKTGWVRWFSSGRPSVGNRVTSPVVQENTDGRLEAFTIGEDGALWHIWQTTANGTWSQWASLNMPAGGGQISFPTGGRNKDGRLEVFVTRRGGALWHIWQTGAGKSWDGWASLGTPPGLFTFSNPFVTENADGRLEAFTNATDGALWHIWQVTPGGPWGS